MRMGSMFCPKIFLVCFCNRSTARLRFGPDADITEHRYYLHPFPFRDFRDRSEFQLQRQCSGLRMGFHSFRFPR